MINNLLIGGFMFAVTCASIFWILVSSIVFMVYYDNYERTLKNYFLALSGKFK